MKVIKNKKTDVDHVVGGDMVRLRFEDVRGSINDVYLTRKQARELSNDIHWMIILTRTGEEAQGETGTD